jgi:hypothetical protein
VAVSALPLTAVVGFDSRARDLRQLSSEGFSPGCPVFLPPQKSPGEQGVVCREYSNVVSSACGVNTWHIIMYLLGAQ